MFQWAHHPQEDSQGAGMVQCGLCGGPGDRCPRDPVTDKRKKMDVWLVKAKSQFTDK